MYVIKLENVKLFYLWNNNS